ncbi:MAG: hypothetical protein JST26_05665 [Bacteroidetes bacterium]|nr:hypothetical protein [Bacteroidota bacterium]
MAASGYKGFKKINQDASRRLRERKALLEQEKNKKKPWQIKRHDFIRQVEHHVDIFGSYPSEITDYLKIVAEYESPLGGTNEFSLVKPTISKARLYAGIVHEALLKKALDEKMPVLNEVMEDYPKLKKDYQMKTTHSSNTTALRQFATFLSHYERIDGYMEEDPHPKSEIPDGLAKQNFRKLGKKAFKELAEYLGLKEYDVRFNPAGPAVSGDLTLMGMFQADTGIYISLSKDGFSNGVLYRAIKSMKDYSGGHNNYFPESDFNEPEQIKKKVYALLKLDSPLSAKSLSDLQGLPNVSVYKLTDQGLLKTGAEKKEDSGLFTKRQAEPSTDTTMKTNTTETDYEEEGYIGDNEISHAKYVWDMPRIEYQQLKAIEKTGYPHILDARDGRKHREFVEWAIKNGKDISQDVLKDYPDLAEEVKEKSKAETKNTKPAKLNTLELLSGDTWFKQHPEKILGEQYQTTDRFNKPVTKVKGTLENVTQGIQVPSMAHPNENTKEEPEIPKAKIKESLAKLLDDPEKKSNLERVIQQTKKEHAEKKLRKLKGEKEKYEDGCPEEYLCFSDILKEYNKGISDEEIKAWIWYKRRVHGYNDEKVVLNAKNGWSKYVVPLGESAKPLKNWLETGIVCCYMGSFMPSVLYYAENIYERESQLLKEKEAIIQEHGQAQFERQWNGLEKVKPPKLTLADPDLNKRLFIKPDSSFAKEIEINSFADGITFVDFSKPQGHPKKGDASLVEAFKNWLKALPKDDFKKSTDWNIIQYYLENGTPSRHHDKEEKLRLRQNAKVEGDRFFVRFLAEALTREDQLRIEQIWNSMYNGYVEINYFKVPVAFTCSSTFKNKPLFIRPAQREGMGFISVHGSGCVAYDVGLGKTMTAILSLAQALESGQCKRPFIVVPNQTYKNWLAEIQGVVDNGKVLLSGLLPQYQVIDLYNLGTEFVDTLRDNEGNLKPVPEYSISVLTYEGFNRLGFNEDTWGEIGNELFDILNQGTEERREQIQLQEKINELMGKGIKGGLVNIEDLGFDYMVVDEAHAMKKSFTQVKGEMKGEGEKATRSRGTYQIHSGVPSMTALRGFMVSQYILRNNNMRNVLLLTATPFTNSPLEIYSMLALIGYQQLERWGIKNIKQFFDTFIKTSMELVINAKLKPERKEIVLGFNNLIALQQLIFKFITYKTGEDAGIQRPKKIVLPLLNTRENGKLVPLPRDKQISTNLPLTARQKEYMTDVELYVRGKTSLTNFCVNTKGMEDDEDSEEVDSGEVLDEKHLSDEEEEGTRILRGMSFARQLALSPYLYACNPDKHPTATQYIETSPKLQYIMECIRSVKRFHEERGEEVSGQVIYMNAGVHFFPLIKEYLVTKIGYREDEVGIIKSGMSAAKKEGIKERFLAGSVKIIIGSATIKEGINLQNRSTVLYNAWLDWNPTDVKQLEGRIWRYGNMYANVRIVNPLMEDSIDTFIFQKLEEKTSRINEIWYRSGKTNALSLEEFNPSELKMGLVTDPYALAELILMEERERMQDEITGLVNQETTLKEIADQRDIFNKNIDHIETVVNRYRPQKSGEKPRSTETLFKIFREYMDDENTSYNYKDQVTFDLVRKAYSAIKRGLEQVLEPRGLDIGFDLKKVTALMDKEIDQKKELREEKTGDDAVQAKGREIIADRIKKGYKPKTVMERVSEFTALNPKLLTELMVYDNSEEAKEKQVQQKRKGEALEGTADRLAKIVQLREVFVRMKTRLEQIKELRHVA